MPRKDAPFHVSADKEVTVPMMHQTERFGYRATDDLQVLEMPYAKGELSMIVLLPKDNRRAGRVGEEADPRRTFETGPRGCGGRR